MDYHPWRDDKMKSPGALLHRGWYPDHRMQRCFLPVRGCQA
jgi:hypothetical protein